MVWLRWIPDWCLRRDVERDTTTLACNLTGSMAHPMDIRLCPWPKHSRRGHQSECGRSKNRTQRVAHEPAGLAQVDAIAAAGRRSPRRAERSQILLCHKKNRFLRFCAYNRGVGVYALGLLRAPNPLNSSTDLCCGVVPLSSDSPRHTWWWHSRCSGATHATVCPERGL